MRLKWLFLPILIILAGIDAQADDDSITVSPDIINSTVTISGYAQAGENICIDIYKPGKIAADFATATEEEIVAYRRQIKTNADGSFSETVVLQYGADKYPFRIGFAGDGHVYDGVIYYTTKADFEEAVRQINSASKDNISSVITQYKTALGWNNELYEKISQSAVAEKIFKALQTEKLNESMPDSVKLFFDKIVILQSINEGVSVNKDEIIKCFELDKRFCNVWKEKMSSENTDKIYAQLLSADYDNEAQFIMRYDELVFLMCIQKLNGYENIEKIIASYSAEYDIGINMSKYNSFTFLQKKEVNTYVLGKTYDSYKTFAKAYNDKISELLNQKNESIITGGGGGGRNDKNSISQIGGASVSPVTPASESNSLNESVNIFMDIDDYGWAKEAITSLHSLGVISGMGENRFAPESYVTREQFVKMIVCAFDIFDMYAEIGFADVPQTDWSYPYIASAVQAGIVRGIDEFNFGYGRQITREDAAVIINRIIASKGSELSDKIIFDDDDKISDYAFEAVYNLVNKGIIAGVGGNRFAPKENCRRCEAAQIIYRSLQKQS